MDMHHNFNLAAATPWATPKATADDYIRQNSRLVQKVARQVHHQVASSIPLEDMVQIGQIALIEAARNFVDRGTAAFSTYATLRVRGAIIDELRRSATISRKALRQRREFERVQTNLHGELGRQPSEGEMAENLDMAIGAYRAAVGAMQTTVYRSIDEEYSDKSSWFADLAPPADVVIDIKRRQEAIATAIWTLPDREQVVLQLYFVDECSLEEISAIFNVGPARICQIKKSALDQLRNKLTSWG
jgi:RNA polymerase sigma factor for flagellar operon FliA